MAIPSGVAATKIKHNSQSSYLKDNITTKLILNNNQSIDQFKFQIIVTLADVHKSF
jgi:hypothetical protein